MNFPDFKPVQSMNENCVQYNFANKRTRHFPQTSSFLDTPIFISFQFFFITLFVCHFINDGYRKNFHYYYSKILIWLSYQAISLSSQKQNLFPEFSFKFFAVKNREISFLKVAFGGKLSKEKTAKLPRKKFAGFPDPPVRSHLCYRKKLFTR